MASTSPVPASVRPTQGRKLLDNPKSHLVARGRVMGSAESSTGQPYMKENGPGNKIDGARFLRYDQGSRTVTVRVDHSTIPDFWLELEVDLDNLVHWAEEQVNEDADGDANGIGEEGDLDE